MLKYRLELLYSIVDKFILVESTTTFTGNSKDLYYQKNKELYNKYADKIIHIIVDDTPETTSAWDREAHQRRCISRGFDNLADSDIILISDLDEIPNPQLLTNIKQSGIDKLYSLRQDMYYYNLTTFMESNWTKTKIMPYSFCKINQDVDKIRYMNCGALNNGGWHLSYFGTSTFISNKIKNFSHQEYNSDSYTNEDLISERVNKKIDLFGRGVYLTNIPLDQNKNLPSNYECLLECLKINA